MSTILQNQNGKNVLPTYHNRGKKYEVYSKIKQKKVVLKKYFDLNHYFVKNMSPSEKLLIILKWQRRGKFSKLVMKYC